MRHRFKFVLLTVMVFTLIKFPHALSGQSGDPPMMFGIGQPATIDELPPGPTKDRLASLPEPVRERALEWLRQLEFPAADLDAMQIDDYGGVFYAEPVLPSPVPDSAKD